jgi:hypothetical protein
LRYKVVHYTLAGDRLTKGSGIGSFGSLDEAEKFVARFKRAVEGSARREGRNVHFEILPEMSPYVFISHSSKDNRMLVSVRGAFDDLSILPDLFEDALVGGPPSREIATKVSEAKALFVFFTKNSCSGDTRDWIVFEMGVACERNLPIYSWKAHTVSKELVPRLTEQLTTYRSFRSSNKGLSKLKSEVRNAAKQLK